MIEKDASYTYTGIAIPVIHEQCLCPHSAVEWRTVRVAVSHDGKLDGKLESKGQGLATQVNDRQQEPARKYCSPSCPVTTKLHLSHVRRTFLATYSP